MRQQVLLISFTILYNNIPVLNKLKIIGTLSEYSSLVLLLIVPEISLKA